MKILKLIIKNSLRHKLRTVLTILGMAIAVIAFGILRTVVTSWNAGVDQASVERLITRHSVSFIFPLPYAYKEKIENIPGVTKVTYQNWFGGEYIDDSHFFARIAVDPETLFEVYPEYVLSAEEKNIFKKERNSCVIGKDIARQFNIKKGDIMSINGDIYTGRWEFVVRGIYNPGTKNTDCTQMFFHWEYLNQRLQEETPTRAGDVGWYIIKINDPGKSGSVSAEIDKLFSNSPAETKTETERAFAQNFMASVSSIITAMDFISFVIVGIIMLVLGNTMIMAARERTREYSVLKTLGFSASHLFILIMGESLTISLIGGGLGLALTFPIIAGFEQVIPKNFFPIFQLDPVTVILSIGAAVLIGVLSAVFPIHRALTTKIVEGFRFVG